MLPETFHTDAGNPYAPPLLVDDLIPAPAKAESPRNILNVQGVLVFLASQLHFLDSIIYGIHNLLLVAGMFLGLSAIVIPLYVLWECHRQRIASARVILFFVVSAGFSMLTFLGL